MSTAKYDTAVRLDADGFMLDLIGFELANDEFSYHYPAEMNAAVKDGDHWIVPDDQRQKLVRVPDALMQSARALLDGASHD